MICSIAQIALSHENESSYQVVVRNQDLENKQFTCGGKLKHLRIHQLVI